MAISGILTTQNHYNQRASGLWPTSFISAPLPNTQWISTLSTTGTNEYYSSVKVDSSGNVYCLGLLNSTDIVLVKYNSAGTIQFQKIYTISSTSTNLGFAGNGLFIDSSDNLYMTGGYTLSGSRGFLIKTNSSGTILYQRSFIANVDHSMQPAGVSVDSTGNVYIIGTSQGFSTNLGGQIAFLTKFNSSGTNQWSINFDSRTSTGTGLAIDSSNNVYMTGYSSSGSGGANQQYVAKINSAGSSLWQAGVTTSSGYVLGQGIALDSSDNVYVTGGHYGSYYSFYSVKVNSGGSSLAWGKVYDTSSGSFGGPVAVDSSGNSYTGAYSQSGNDNMSVIVKHNSGGTLQWQRTINKVNTTDSDFRTALHIDNTGDFYGVGSATNTTDQDSIVYKLPLDGTKTGTYTVGGRSIVYGSSNFSTSGVSFSLGSNPSHTLNTGGLSVATPTFSVSDITATSSTTTI